MKSLITCIILITVFLLTFQKANAQEVTAGASASLNIGEVSSNETDYRVTNLKRYLISHNSPLAEYAADFVKWADFYGIDYRMVPAISGVESTFGKNIPQNSYNAYGWNNGDYRFTSWDVSILHVTRTLKLKYLDKGALSINAIARRYAPPSTTWGRNVRFFMQKIDPIPLNFDIIT